MHFTHATFQKFFLLSILRLKVPAHHQVWNSAHKRKECIPKVPIMPYNQKKRAQHKMVITSTLIFCLIRWQAILVLDLLPLPPQKVCALTNSSKTANWSTYGLLSYVLSSGKTTEIVQTCQYISALTLGFSFP